MPHKRAKRSVREQIRNQKGADLAPAKQALGAEAIPKSLARVLNAEHIREEWKVKKRKFEEDGDRKRKDKKRRVEGSGNSEVKAQGNGEGKEETGRKGKLLGIQPGESLQHFNRRVEDDMRPLVKSAMQTSLAVARSVRKTELEGKKNKNKTENAKSALRDVDKPVRSPSPVPPQKHAGRPKEFQTTSSSAPRRLNDIAQAPPEFKKLPHGAIKRAVRGGGGGGGDGGGGKREGVLSMAQRVMMEEQREKAIARYREMKTNRKREGEGGDERDRDGADEE